MCDILIKQMHQRRLKKKFYGYEYKLGGIKKNMGRDIMSETFRYISKIRIKLLSVASETDLSYKELLQSNLSITATEDCWDKVTIDVMRRLGGWSRFMQYSDGQSGFHRHTDSVGEIMAILFLSQPGLDYRGGLFGLDKDNREFCIDTMTSRCDLLILDGNYYPHRVDIVPLTDKGRVTYFINFNPFDMQGVNNNIPGEYELKSLIVSE